MDEMEKKDAPQEEPVAQPQQEKDVYVPRPAWQVWGARVALVIFIIFLIMYYINVARGGA